MCVCVFDGGFLILGVVVVDMVVSTFFVVHVCVCMCVIRRAGGGVNMERRVFNFM